MTNINAPPYTFEHKIIKAQEMRPKKIVKPIKIMSIIVISPCLNYCKFDNLHAAESGRP